MFLRSRTGRDTGLVATAELIILFGEGAKFWRLKRSGVQNFLLYFGGRLMALVVRFGWVLRDGRGIPLQFDGR